MSKIEVNTIDAQCGSTITVGSSGKNIKIEGNDIRSNDYKASDGGNIINQSGTSITIGASGDTVSLASGASQSGFGRSGSVDWQTSIKTSGFTAVSGEGYFCNTTDSAFTVTLPSSPSVGDIVAIKDYAATFADNNLTLGRNSSNIGGIAENLDLATDQQSVTLVYADATKGWLAVSDSTSNSIPQKFVTATGGNTVATCGNFKIHTFTGPGTFCVSCAGNPAGSNTVDYLVIAGGGGGGKSGYPNREGGGAGAGGYRESSGTASGSYSRSPLGACVSALPVTAQGYPITVGGGGAGSTGPAAGVNGNPSVFSTITSTAGGGGTTRIPPGGYDNGKPGGSGGGAGSQNTGGFGTGNTPPVSPPQGNPGGEAERSGGNENGAGGGGATGTGGGSPPSGNGSGGAGATSSINSTPTTRASGGSGAGQSGSGAATPGGGGAGDGSNGLGNTGGGGGANGPGGSGGTGGSGIVIIRYKYQ